MNITVITAWLQNKAMTLFGKQNKVIFTFVKFKQGMVSGMSASLHLLGTYKVNIKVFYKSSMILCNSSLQNKCNILNVM